MVTRLEYREDGPHVGRPARRAEKRGKTLPDALRRALTQAASTDRTPTTTC